MIPADTDWRPGADARVLRERARLLATIRAFFAARDVLEVTTPVLSRYAIPTPAIDSFEAGPPTRFLRTSPELAIKRLLANGLGDAYELGPVFRQGEVGRRHNPEFTLLEWYRVGWDEHRLMDEVAQLVAELLGGLEAPRRAPYGTWLHRATGLDVHAASEEALRCVLLEHTELPDTPLTRDDLLDLVFAYVVAPTFPTSSLTFVHDYPASQAVLAQLSDADPRVARRFEVYLGELELGNGFFELRDAAEQRERFARENDVRRAQGKAECPADEAFLAALEAGLPECAGVAVGVDRIVMLATGVDDIASTLAFGFDVA